MMNHEDAVINIEAMMEGAEAPVSNECCIYRVPFPIRRLKEDAYTPMVVSIGPFHQNLHSHLQNMERIKLTFCKAFLAKTQTSSDSWIHYIQGIEPNIRRCYSDKLAFSQDELVKIIFVDSGFIFELFFRSYDNDWLKEDDSFLLTDWLSSTIMEDLLLLENQLPFFVLDRLFCLSMNCLPRFSVINNYKIPSFLELTLAYFDGHNKSNLIFYNINIKHFTDLLRIFHLQHPLDRRPPRTNDFVTHLPSVTELSEAGVRFKVNTQSNCLLDLSFSAGVLEIPLLRVFDRTERLFRNMVALEQCHYPKEAYITDYVFILDFLVNTSKDVDILVRKKVMGNWLGDTDSVANMINSLFKNVVMTNLNSRYVDMCQNLNVLYNNPWRIANLKSTLRRDYCKTPWQTAASIAAILILFLTVVQTVCSVWQPIKQ